MKKVRFFSVTTAYILLTTVLTGCGPNGQIIPDTPVVSPSQVEISQEAVSTTAEIPEESQNGGTRDNTPVCLIPIADGTAETRNDVAVIDYSQIGRAHV